MKAIIYYEYGSADVLKYEELENPVPKENEVLVRVRAASVNPLDWRMMKGGGYFVRLLLGMLQPKVKRPGVDVAGQVEAIGSKVTTFKPGDAVFGLCKGAFAEYVSVPESKLAIKPGGLNFEEAAAIPVAGLTALQGLRDKGNARPGQNVLINGAAGGVGTFAVQIAKTFDLDVTGVCSTRNLEMVRSLGADHVIDYTREDFTHASQTYDVILDCIGNHSLSALKRVLTPKGVCVGIGIPHHGMSTAGLVARMIGALVRTQLTRQTFPFFIAKMSKDDLTILGDLMTAGKIKAVIDRRYRLSEVPEVLRYLEEGHARGKVVITPN